MGPRNRLSRNRFVLQCCLEPILRCFCLWKFSGRGSLSSVPTSNESYSIIIEILATNGKTNQINDQFSLFLLFSDEVIRRIDEYSAALVIEHISSEHSGNYTCISSNVAGTERFTVPVTVNVPPKWILQPKDSSVQAGEDISLHCQADGYPTPVVTWSKYSTFSYVIRSQ